MLYTAENWLKNRGALHPDLVALLATSDHPLVSELFSAERCAAPPPHHPHRRRAAAAARAPAAARAAPPPHAHPAAAARTRRRTRTRRPSRRRSEKKQTVVRVPLVLRALSDTMAATNQHYIRCLKPNMLKKANLFHGDVLTRQLGYTGCAASRSSARATHPDDLQGLRGHLPVTPPPPPRAPPACPPARPRAPYSPSPPRHSRPTPPRLAWSQRHLLRQTAADRQEPAERRDRQEPARVRPGGEREGLARLDDREGRHARARQAKVHEERRALHLEAPSAKVTGKAALVIQKDQQRYLVQKSLGVIKFHRNLVAEIKVALKKGDGKVASEKLEELEKSGRA